MVSHNEELIKLGTRILHWINKKLFQMILLLLKKTWVIMKKRI